MRHAPSGGGDQKVESVNLGNVSAYAAEDAAEPKTADLRWGDGVSKVFTGLISSQVALDLKVCPARRTTEWPRLLSAEY